MFFIRTFAFLVPLVAQTVVAIPPFSDQARFEAFNASTEVYKATNPLPLIYNGCTDSRNRLIDSAHAMFVPLSRGAKKWYDAITLPGVDPTVQLSAQSVHTQFFGTLTPQDNQKWRAFIITQIYKNATQGGNDRWAANSTGANREASPLSIDCEGLTEVGCKPNFRAYTTAGSKAIHMCPLYFEPDRGPKEFDCNILSDKRGQIAGGTIVHEISDTSLVFLKA